MYYIKIAVVTVVCLIAAISDYKTKKIKNNITVSLALVGLATSIFFSDVSFKSSLLGFVIPFIVCLPFYCLKMIRAGDVKLFMAVGAVMGLRWVLGCMASSIIAGGVLSIFIMIKRRCFIKRFCYLGNYLKTVFYMAKLVAYVDDKDPNACFPFGIAVFCGVVIKIIMDYACFGGV